MTELHAREPVRVLLLDPVAELLDAWRVEFAASADMVEVHHGGFQERLGEFDALLSPGNSYGQMDGGIDGIIAATFPKVQRAVWRRIAERHHGYQPVGTAEVIPTEDDRCGWLVYAPTMRIPMALDGGRDVSVHDALWAGLIATERHNREHEVGHKIRTLACPGLGTGIGRVRPSRAAQLMATAYELWRTTPDTQISHRERRFSDE